MATRPRDRTMSIAQTCVSRETPVAWAACSPPGAFVPISEPSIFVSAYLQVTTTVASETDARRLAEFLVQGRLAACVQIVGPIHSVYWWQGKVESSSEWQCIAKTRADLLPRLEAALISEHPYDTPEVLALPIERIADKYRDWLERELLPSAAVSVEAATRKPGARLFRVIVPVADIERAARFYAQLLAMPGERVSPGRHYFDCGGTILACYDALADGDPGPVGPNPEHVYLALDDLEAAFVRAREAGCRELEASIAVRPWGERSFYARDPFGNPLCLVDAATVYTGGPIAS